jgi:hypothetical protein
MLRYFIFSFILLALLVPNVGEAINLNLKYPIPPGAPDINTKEDQSLTGIVAWFYYLIVMISGLAAFAMIVWGGVQYLTSAGDPPRMADARDRIKNAVLGLAIVLASFLILQIISPEFTMLTEPTI